MGTKILQQFDGLNTRDKSRIKNTFDTSITFVSQDTGEVIFKTKNKVILPGSGCIARKIFDIDTPEITPTYNAKLGLITPDGTPTATIVTNTKATEKDPKILLFCLGTDGCGAETSQVYPVDYKHWISPDDLIPFRFQVIGHDISPELRETYFGRKEINDEFIAYYFKRYEGTPKFVQQFVNGDTITEDIFDTTRTDLAESYVEITLKVLKEDIRDYFAATVGIDEARINSISLCTAWPVEIDGVLYFNDIRPFTKLHIPNEYMNDVTKGIDIIYHIYM